MNRSTLVVLIAGALLIGGVFFSTSKQPEANTAETPVVYTDFRGHRTVRANKFELVGEDGKVIAGLKYVGKNIPIFFMSDTNGNELISIALRDYGPDIELRDRNNQLRMEAEIVAGNPSITFYDKNRNKSVELHYLDDLPSFHLNNREGKVQIGMDYSGHDNPRIYVASKDGWTYPRAELSYNNHKKCAKLNLATNKNVHALAASVCEGDFIEVFANSENPFHRTVFTMIKGKPKWLHYNDAGENKVWEGK